MELCGLEYPEEYRQNMQRVTREAKVSWFDTIVPRDMMMVDCNASMVMRLR